MVVPKPSPAGRRIGGRPCKLDQLKALCHDNEAALRAIEKACPKVRGGDRRSEEAREKAKEIKHDNVMIDKAEQGNTKSYGIRRLEKHRPDLHQRVLAKQMSVQLQFLN